MRRPASGAAAFGTALALVAACGGGGGRSATTTSAPPSTEGSTTTGLPTTTSTTIDPLLKELLLTAEDLPSFKEKAAATEPTAEDASACDSVDAAGLSAIENEPSADGPTLVRGPKDDVEVSSNVTGTTPEKAEAALTDLLDPKLKECIETDARTELAKDLPADATLSFKTTATKANVAGVDQAVLVSSIVTVTGSGADITGRFDLVFLRQEGTILLVTYGGPTSIATSAERQRIVAIAARKLANAASGGTSTTAGAGGSSTSSTSSSGRTSSTRRSSSTTRGGSTSSSRTSTTSTTR